MAELINVLYPRDEKVMSISVSTKRMWIWLKRFHRRRGYGVHSPFAFNLITWVIYEKYPYYKYTRLDEIRRQLKSEGKGKYLNRTKVNQLLFRLVNRMQPDSVIEVGTLTGLTTLYLSQAKVNTCCETFDDVRACNEIATRMLTGLANIRFHKGDILSELRETLVGLPSVDFLYLDDRDCAEQAFEACVKKTTARSLFVIKGIRSSSLKKKWWQRVVDDERTGITFDLYDLGLVFFDKQKIKQHYIINF